MKKEKDVLKKETSVEEDNDQELDAIFKELENDTFTSIDDSNNKKEEKDTETSFDESIEDIDETNYTNEKKETKEEVIEEVKDDVESQPIVVEEVKDDVETEPIVVEEVETHTEPEEKKKTISEKEVEPKEKNKEPKKKGKIKWQTIFNLVSFVFLVGCVIFYGYRLVHYYRIYNPKTEDGKEVLSIGEKIRRDYPVLSKGDGLYSVSGEFVFKGEEINNYVEYSNLLWRIVKVRSDNSVVLTTDQIVNNLVWSNDNKDYLKSDINTWLNKGKEEHSGVFEAILNDKKNFLAKQSLCVDVVDDLKKIVCSDFKEVGYVGLLGITDFANSVVDGKSYLNNTVNLWLYNTSKDKVWNVTNGNITSSEPTSGYGIKPTILLTTNVVIVSGKGTKEEPYKIENKDTESKIGKYVDLNGEIWQIYEENKDYLRLVSNKLYNDGDTTYKFSNEGNKFDPLVPYSLAYHLNNSIYKTYNYNDQIIDCDWYIGSYQDKEGYDYRNVYNEKLTAKVGLYNIADIKLNTDLNDYYYLTPDGEDKVYGFNNSSNLYSMKHTYMKAIRPAICIKNNKFTGKGTLDKPYKLEASNEKEE